MCTARCCAPVVAHAARARGAAGPAPEQSLRQRDALGYTDVTHEDERGTRWTIARPIKTLDSRAIDRLHGCDVAVFRAGVARRLVVHEAGEHLVRQAARLRPQLQQISQSLGLDAPQLPLGNRWLEQHFREQRHRIVEMRCKYGHREHRGVPVGRSTDRGAPALELLAQCISVSRARSLEQHSRGELSDTEGTWGLCRRTRIGYENG
jgi:hypothetical protein